MVISPVKRGWRGGCVCGGGGGGGAERKNL